MVRLLFPALIAVAFLSSCSALRTIPFSSNKQGSVTQPGTVTTRFIEEIAVVPKQQTDRSQHRSGPSAPASEKTNLPAPAAVPAVTQPVLPAETGFSNSIAAAAMPEVERAGQTQLKYAILLNTEVESLPDCTLLEAVDEWYGVRYRSGGNTKKGIDCSGFTVAVYATVYGLMLPRVSREQYRQSRKISTTELTEGDLLFFNTNGRGVSHVGIYLGNNKFIHASVSRGVMVNDLFEEYYIKRFVGAGRIEEKETLMANR